MENNGIENLMKNRTCYYFDDIIEIKDFDFNNFLLDEKSFENILIYDILHKTLISTKLLHIMFDKVNEFIRDYSITKCVIFFGPEEYDAIFDRIRYLIGLKSSMLYVASHKSRMIQMMMNEH